MSVKQVLEDWRQTLLRIPGVSIVGRSVGSSSKIVIYVEKLSLQILSAVPPFIEGIPVELRQSGKIRILSMMPRTLAQSRTSRFRPLVGGCSIGSIHITAGTLGGIAVDNLTGELVGLSNNHVLLSSDWGTQAGYPNGEIVQPGTYDGGSLPNDLAGYGERGVPVKIGAENLVDSAIFRPTVPISREILDVALPLYPTVVEPYVGMNVQKSGRTTGLLTGKVTAIDATADVSGWGTCRFTDQVIVEPAILQGGDSGSLGLSDRGDPALLGFAGSDTVSVFNLASNVAKLQNISILGSGISMVPPEVAPGFGSALMGCGLLLLSLV